MPERPHTNWDPEQEEHYGLAIAPLLNEIAEMVKAKLPPGTDFGVLVFAPSPESGQEGRVLAVTTDRTRVAQYAARWVLTVLNPENAG